MIVARQAAPPAPAGGVAFGFVLLSAGEFIAKLLTFGTFSYLARVLGPARYGDIEFTLAVMVFFSLPVDFGLATYGAREVARNKARAATLLTQVTALRMLLALMSALGLAVFISLADITAEVKWLLSMYGLSLFGGPLLVQWIFQAFDRMQWVALASIVRHGVFAALTLTFLRPGVPLAYIGAIECAAVGAACLFCVRFTGSRLGLSVFAGLSWSGLVPHLRPALPIGLIDLAWAFMWYFATVLLGLYSPGPEVGFFGASHRALMALHTFVWLYFFNLLPSISRCFGKPHSELRRLLDPSMAFCCWAGLFVALLVTLFAPQLLELAYGSAFAQGSGAFVALGWMIPIAMLSGHYRFTLIAYNHQDVMLYCSVGSAVVSIGLAFVLIPMYGALGAAAALLGGNLANFAVVYIAVRRLAGDIPFLRELAKPLLGLAIAFAVSYGTGETNALKRGIAVALFLMILAMWDRSRVVELITSLARRRRESEAEVSPA